MRYGVIGGIATLFVLAPLARADESTTGTIEGHVRATRVPALASPRPIGRQQQVCGREALDESVVVGSNGALANAVAWVAGLPRPEGLRPGAVRLDQQHCRFVPHVLTATTGATLEVTSQDAVLHTAHAVLGRRRTLFNVAIPVAGLTVRKLLTVAGRVHFFCDVGHTWMSAFLFVFHHPYHAVSGVNGSFRIADVPPGDWTVHLWHERLGERTVPAHVTAGATARVSVEL